MTGSNKLGAVVMAAGLGTRMKSALPKHLHPILGRRMVDWVLAAAQELELGRLVIVASSTTAEIFPGQEVTVQERPLGTGDAVRSARALLEGRDQEILVLSGDTPLLTVRAAEQARRYTPGRERPWLPCSPSALRMFAATDACSAMRRVV